MLGGARRLMLGGAARRSSVHEGGHSPDGDDEKADADEGHDEDTHRFPGPWATAAQTSARAAKPCISPAGLFGSASNGPEGHMTPGGGRSGRVPVVTEPFRPVVLRPVVRRLVRRRRPLPREPISESSHGPVATSRAR